VYLSLTITMNTSNQSVTPYACPRRHTLPSR